MEADESTPSGIAPAPTGALLLVVACLVGADLITDLAAGGSALHFGLEGAAALLALAGAVGAVSVAVRDRRLANERLRIALDEANTARERSKVLAEQASRWRAEAEASLRGLGEAIDRQFSQWGLTDAEAEVAWLLLKGLSTKEIAVARATTDRTVRQQAQSVYARSGLAGRAELSAFFLEDLMPARVAHP
jgi:DNA-binding CsgD family transcriptional regulator